jgi:hypothetical protein
MIFYSIEQDGKARGLVEASPRGKILAAWPPRQAWAVGKSVAVMSAWLNTKRMNLRRLELPGEIDTARNTLHPTAGLFGATAP